ncbi:MAG: PAS domain S-box protein, partial [Oceanobacter sp.]
MSFLKQLFADEQAGKDLRDMKARMDALNKSQAVIEFDTNGTILDANDNFLNVMGYRLDEIRGQHHSLFVEPDYASSSDYQRFWDNLRRG